MFHFQGILQSSTFPLHLLVNVLLKIEEKQKLPLVGKHHKITKYVGTFLNFEIQFFYLLYWLMASYIITGFQIWSNSSSGSNFMLWSPFFRCWNLRRWSTHFRDISNFGFNILLLSSIEITSRIVRFKKQSIIVWSRLKTLSFSYKSSTITIFFSGQCASSDPSLHSRNPLHLSSEGI